MWVLMVHHIQVILICFHISQQVVCRDIAALRLLVVCVPQEREISSSYLRHKVGFGSPISCPSQTAQLPSAVTFLALTATTAGVTEVNCPAPWGSACFTWSPQMAIYS